ncbi:MAG TPA: hypothetical protein VE398_16650 [Acidobacteriota bacterium]|nr:hypothetical protein [Acidobacteriota bacterium]
MRTRHSFAFPSFLLIVLTLQVVGSANPCSVNQSVLLRFDSLEIPETVKVKTYAGMTESSIARVDPSPEVVIVILTDTIGSENLEKLRKDLSALYQSLGKSNPITIALIGGTELQKLGPIKSRTQLQNALRTMARQAAQARDPTVMPNPYVVLSNVIDQLGGDWSSVLLVGRFPELTPDQQEYLEADISERSRARNVRINCWTPDGQPPSLIRSVAAVTAGSALTGDLTEFAEILNRQPQSFARLTWTGPALTAGFHLYRAELIDRAQQSLFSVPSIACGSDSRFLSIEGYAELRELARSIEIASHEPQLSADQSEQLLRDIGKALVLNPRDRASLRLGADFHKRSNNPKAAAALLEPLTELEPDNAALFVELGQNQFLSSNLAAAEKSLLRGRELRSGSALAAELIGRIHVLREDYSGSIPFLEESLQLSGNNQDLWFLRANAAQHIGDWHRGIDSLERGLQLGGSHLSERTTLVRLYMDHDDAANALKHVRLAIPALPRDPTILSTYAAFLEKLDRGKEALDLWRKTLELDPVLEPAHYGVAHLSLDLGDSTGALRASTDALKAAPKSGRIHLLKSRAEETLGMWYESRRTLQRAASEIDDVPLLRRNAEVEDTFGRSAPASYETLVSAMERSSTLPADFAAVLERGLEVSLRDGDMRRASWFSEKLRGAGHAEAASWLGSAQTATVNGITVPGGLKALMFVVQGKEQVSAGQFMLEYCRSILNLLSSGSDRPGRVSLEYIIDYFDKVWALERLGTRTGARVTVQVSVRDKNSRQAAERVARLLGWQLHTSRQGVTLEAVEKSAAAKRQMVAIALGIDMVGMQEALQSKGDFSFDIVDEWVPILLKEDVWRNQFYAGENFRGGFAEAVTRDPRLAKLYVGLVGMDDEAFSAVVTEIGLKTLADKFVDLLLPYSSAFAVSGGHALVPGGVGAEPLWERLVGAKPAHPARFFRSLLHKDDGRLLAFFFALTQLDLAHQKFFTLNQSRLSKFYDLFAESPDVHYGATRSWRSTPFISFFGELPLDDQEHVNFPGSPEVWMVAKGQSGSAGKTAKLLRKLSRTAAPDVEDEILLRMARTSYKAANEELSELSNFMAVSRLDAHRSEPLDEASALMLAQGFAEYQYAWPYFSILTGLGQEQYSKFFAMGEKLRQRDRLELNRIMAQIHSLVELLCIARQSDALDEKASSEVFSLLCDRFSSPVVDADLTSASLEVLREILKHSAKTADASDPDAAIKRLLMGPPTSAVSVEIGATTHRLDGARTRHDNFQRLLELQRVPSLKDLMDLYGAAQQLIAGKGNLGQQVDILDEIIKRIPTVEVPKELKLKGKAKDNLESFLTKDLQETVFRLRRTVAKRKVNQKEVQKLAREFLGRLNPQIQLGLVGLIYAAYLNPSDLSASEDPLLLRKHEFINLTGDEKRYTAFEDSDLAQGEKTETHLRGGLSSFAMPAGRIGANGGRWGDERIELFASAQIGFIRATRWEYLRDEDLRLLGMKIRAAREWIVRSAGDSKLQSTLAEAILGLVSLSRRADLFRALNSRDWASVWQSVTLSDLLFLADEYFSRYETDSWQSPTVTALRKFMKTNDGSRLMWLGPNLNPLNNCSHPHLMRLAPYEQYERFLLPERLTVRAGEFKLYFAEYADRSGLPAAALGAIAEPVARALYRDLQLTDYHDWRAVTSALASLNDELIQKVLGKP